MAFTKIHKLRTYNQEAGRASDGNILLRYARHDFRVEGAGRTQDPASIIAQFLQEAHPDFASGSEIDTYLETVGTLPITSIKARGLTLAGDQAIVSIHYGTRGGGGGVLTTRFSETDVRNEQIRVPWYEYNAAEDQVESAPLRSSYHDRGNMIVTVGELAGKNGTVGPDTIETNRRQAAINHGKLYVFDSIPYLLEGVRFRPFNTTQVMVVGVFRTKLPIRSFPEGTFATYQREVQALGFLDEYRWDNDLLLTGPLLALDLYELGEDLPWLPTP